ncbi:hypothetical protein ACI2T3_08605 [Ralstonia nicotianae]
MITFLLLDYGSRWRVSPAADVQSSDQKDSRYSQIMAKIALPVHELEFLKLSSNYLELARKLSTLGWPTPDLARYAQYVCTAWFHLGEEHLLEAKKILAAGCRRACFSRAYYAAYNASKGVRYMVRGFVSLKGDDHSKASSDLPDDFPDVGSWASRVGKLYEHRLRADYDNWGTTASEDTLKPDEAVAEAEAFRVANKTDQQIARR